MDVKMQLYSTQFEGIRTIDLLLVSLNMPSIAMAVAWLQWYRFWAEHKQVDEIKRCVPMRSCLTVGLCLTSLTIYLTMTSLLITVGCEPNLRDLFGILFTNICQHIAWVAVWWCPGAVRWPSPPATSDQPRSPKLP